MRPGEYLGSDLHHRRVERGLDHCDDPIQVHVLANVVRQGLVHLAGADSPLTTSPLRWGERNLYLFAVGEDFSMRIGGPDGERSLPSVVKHETLFSGQRVRAAGEIQFDEGVVVDLSDTRPGVSRPSPSERDQLVDLSTAARVHTEEVARLLHLKTQQLELGERDLLLRALQAAGGSKAKAAALLGIPVRTLASKLRRLQVRKARTS